MAIGMIMWLILLIAIQTAFIALAVILLRRQSRCERKFGQEELELQKTYFQDGIPPEIYREFNRRHLWAALKHACVYLGLMLLLGAINTALFFYIIFYQTAPLMPK